MAIGIAMFAIPVLPLFHIYALYKRYLGPLEFRANRLLSLYSFSLLCVTALALALLVGERWTPSPDVFIVFVLAVSMVLVIAKNCGISPRHFFRYRRMSAGVWRTHYTTRPVRR